MVDLTDGRITRPAAKTLLIGGAATRWTAYCGHRDLIGAAEQPNLDVLNHSTAESPRPRISAGRRAIIKNFSRRWLHGSPRLRPGGQSDGLYVYASPPCAENARSCRESGLQAGG
jgi:hypothetical protein